MTKFSLMIIKTAHTASAAWKYVYAYTTIYVNIYFVISIYIISDIFVHQNSVILMVFRVCYSLLLTF